MKLGSLVITIGIALISIGGILTVNYLNIKEKTTPKEVIYEYVPVENEIIFGDINSPNKIIEFGSYTCPHCAEFYTSVVPSIKSGLVETGEAVFIYRHLPIDSISNAATNITSCDKDNQEKILDIFYRNQNKLIEIGSLASDEEVNVGNEIYTLLVDNGISVTEEHKTCAFSSFTQEKNATIMQEQIQTFQLEATPTIIVNGLKMVGIIPAEEIIQKIRNK